ncbi:MAG: hypothetical protein ACLQQ4_03320 [Bacteroidia bacterium]
MRKIQNKVHCIYCDENGIVHIEVLDGAHIDREAMIESHKVAQQLGGDKNLHVMVDARAHHTMTEEAMDFLKNESIDKGRAATAIVTERLGIRIIVDYIAKEKKGQSHISMFPTPEQALQWLISLKDRKN